MHEEILAATGHRPFPLPDGPWIAFQSWQSQLFAHWPIAPEELRPLVPAPLAIDTHEGQAWLTATPFRVAGFHARGLPPLPPVAEYLELNLRTYVRLADVPGVWFFSLDASSRLAAVGGRSLYRLPYYAATMRMREEAGSFTFESRRADGVAAFRATWAPGGPVTPAAPGSLDHFLAERYTLYARLHGGGVLRAHIHHGPWPLQPAGAELDAGGLLAAAGLAKPGGAPLLHFAARQDTLIWAPEKVR